VGDDSNGTVQKDKYIFEEDIPLSIKKTLERTFTEIQFCFKKSDMNQEFCRKN
jgi:hypothetical protein